MSSYGEEKNKTAGRHLHAVQDSQATEFQTQSQPSEEVQFGDYHSGLQRALQAADDEIADLVENEFERQRDTIQLIAAENQCSRAVLGALGSVVQNKTTEGFAHKRFHGGCEVVDQMELLAIERAKQAFGARYANVQPHSGTQANQIVISAIVGPGEKILSLATDQGGHISHGADVSFTGRFFEVENYSVDRETFLLDYDAIETQARRVKPKLIICGATAYARRIDFARFRKIADSVGAYLLADVSHISGLIMAGAHPSCIDHAHFTTTSTYKPGGPRGGLILMGRDFDKTIKAGSRQRPLWKHIDKMTFPGVQGTPYLNHIAAKAVFFKEMMTREYVQRQFRIVENAKSLAAGLKELGYDVLTGGTDNHMVLVNVSNFRQDLTGLIAQNALEECGIVINMNRLPFDPHGPAVTSGMRLGTPIVTKRGMGPEQMACIAQMIDSVLRRVELFSKNQYEIDPAFRRDALTEVRSMCRQFPVN